MTLKVAYKREDRPNEIGVLTLQTFNPKLFDTDASLTFSEKKDGSEAVNKVSAEIVNYQITES